MQEARIETTGGNNFIENSQRKSRDSDTPNSTIGWNKGNLIWQQYCRFRCQQQLHFAMGSLLSEAIIDETHLTLHFERGKMSIFPKRTYKQCRNIVMSFFFLSLASIFFYHDHTFSILRNTIIIKFMFCSDALIFAWHAFLESCESLVISEFSLLPQALSPIGALFGSFIAGYITNAFGRKAALVLVMIPYLIGYFIIACSQYVSGNTTLLAVLFIGRFFTGIGLGWSCLAVPVSLYVDNGVVIIY